MLDQNSNQAELENPQFLQSQLITYIGNKRALLSFISKAIKMVQEKTGKQKLECLDLFSGSGVVSRFLKQYSSSLTVNDLETYSVIINRCYLANLSNTELSSLKDYYSSLIKMINQRMQIIQDSKINNTFTEPGFITKLYSPKNLDSIQKNERCFYTPYNANYIDVTRQLIKEHIPLDLQDFFIAPLLSESSIHANTAGIFKGFYKNSTTKIGQFGGNGKDALSRIMGNIALPFPIFSNFDCDVNIYNCDANNFVKENSKHYDLAYFDPPYNQHPYGSNYFMLNLIANYKEPSLDSISKVSGIPKNWNRSLYNKKHKVYQTFLELVQNVNADYVLVSFNSEGFIPKEEMKRLLETCGKVTILESDYNTFRASRNLKKRAAHVKEFLFLLEKH